MKQLQYIWKASLLKLLNGKTTAFACIMLAMCWDFNRPMNRYIDAVDYPVSWCVFPFLMARNVFLFMFWLGIIYINSDVPFMQHVNMYHLIRTGRRRWAVGQMGGIFVRSFAAVLYTAACTVLPLLPRVEFTNEWGKLLHSAAVTDAATAYGFEYFVYYEIFSEYTPLQLMGICIALCTFISGFLGMLMFLASLYAGKAAAVALAFAVSVLLFFVENVHPEYQYKMALFVPAIWGQAAKSATPRLGYYWMPPLPYMSAFLAVSTAVMAVLILHKIKTAEFDWENEDI